MKKLLLGIIFSFSLIFSQTDLTRNAGAILLYNYFIDFIADSSLGTSAETRTNGEIIFNNKFIDFLLWADTANVDLVAQSLNLSHDLDSLKIDLSNQLKVIDLEINNTTVFSVDSVGNIYAIGDIAVEVGDVIIQNATPSLQFKDTDGTDDDTNVQIEINLTDTGTNAEDADVTLSQQIAGTMTPFLTADADGTIDLGSATQNTNVLGDLDINDSLSVDGNATFARTTTFSDSAFIDTLEFNVIYGLDSLNVDSLNFVPDSEKFTNADELDPQWVADSSAIISAIELNTAKVTDTVPDSLAIDALNFVPDLELANYLPLADVRDSIDVRVDSTFIDGLGFVAGAHTVDTTLDSTGVDALNFVPDLEYTTGMGAKADSGAVFYLAQAETVTGIPRFQNGAGIGLTRTEGTLHVQTGSAGSVTADINDLVVENSSNGGISILTPDANYGAVYFGSPSDDNAARLRWQWGTAGAVNQFVLTTYRPSASVLIGSGDNVTALTIDGNQDVGIGIAPVTGCQLLLPQENDAVTPTLSFGTGNMGLYAVDANTVRMADNGTARFEWTAGQFRGAHGSSGAMYNIASSSTQPTFCPRNSDLDTGIGWAAADQLSLIAGGVEGIRITENTTIAVDVNGSLKSNTYNFFADSSSVNDSWGFVDTEITTLTTGLSLFLNVGVANTDGATLQINALGAKAVLKNHDVALATGDVEVGQIVHLIYDGTQFQMLSQLAQ